jgi:hypothetical protein
MTEEGGGSEEPEMTSMAVKSARYKGENYKTQGGHYEKISFIIGLRLLYDNDTSARGDAS